MTPVTIPVVNTQFNYSVKVPLDGVVFGLSFRWNARALRWLMDIADSNGIILLAGLPILEGEALTKRFIGRVAGLPLGNFATIDGTAQMQDASDLTFGISSRLIYFGKT